MRITAPVGLALVVLACGLGCSSPTPTTPNTPNPSPTPTPVFVPPTLPPLPAGLSALMTSMLNSLPAQVTQALTENQQLLPNNPHLTSQLNAKIAMLRSPSILIDIVNGARWVEGQSMGTSIGLVFPLEHMRADANDAVSVLTSALPVLEGFMGEPFPAPTVRVWYGFVMGNKGGGGSIYSEERSSYVARVQPNALPYDSILCHELSHSFMANEALNQFLELYVYNSLRGSSTDPSTWTFTRNWTPGLGSNRGITAIMDVYQLIGHDAMRAAYRAVRPLRPAYNSPLSPQVLDAFVSVLPADLRAAVRAKLATIIA